MSKPRIDDRGGHGTPVAGARLSAPGGDDGAWADPAEPSGLLPDHGGTTTTPARPEDILAERDAILAPPDLRLYSALRRMMSSGTYRTVVTLGGGSLPALGGNTALLRLFEELELRPLVECIWGTSAGAVAGGGWATGCPALDILALIMSLDRRGSLDVLWGRILLAILLRPFGMRLPDALVRGRHFHRTIDAGLRVKTFEESELPFRCIACTDGPRSRRVVFESGALLPAISASMSLPGLLQPQRPDGTAGIGYYDGGLVEKTPLRSPIAEHLRSGDSRRLLLVGTHFSSEATQVDVARGFLARFIMAIRATESSVWDYQHAEARKHDNVTLLLWDPHIPDPASFDFQRTELNYLHARRFFKDRLQNANLALSLAMP